MQSAYDSYVAFSKRIGNTEIMSEIMWNAMHGTNGKVGDGYRGAADMAACAIMYPRRDQRRKITKIEKIVETTNSNPTTPVPDTTITQ